MDLDDSKVFLPCCIFSSFLRNLGDFGVFFKENIFSLKCLEIIYGSGFLSHTKSLYFKV